MTYTGDVSPGGPSEVRELDGLTVRKAAVSDMHNNVYLLTCQDTGDQLLVDAADDPARLRALVAEGTGQLQGIVTTHQHWDHHRALPELVETMPATTYAGAPDADALPVPVERRLEQGDRVDVGTCHLDVVRLTGHTPGSIALAWTDPAGTTHLFTGDSLFPGGPGKTDGPAEFDSLMDDLERRVFDVYGDDTWVYPGHGADTTLGAERPHLSEWRARGW